MQHIIAIDPSGNGHTGIFIGYFENDKFVQGYQATFHHTQFKAMMQYLQPHLETKADVVIEDYQDRGITLNNSTKSFLTEIKLNCIAINPNIVVHFQQPSFKALWTNKRLQTCNLLIKQSRGFALYQTNLEPKPTRHVYDAVRHFMYRLVQTYQGKIDLQKFFGAKENGK